MHGGKKITLCVTASIAVYKAAELVRELERAGYEVSVAMSPRATEFVAPLTFETLSHRKVATDFFSLGDAGAIPHIALADSADLVLVAPATADIMAKAAAGLADEIVSAILLATKAPVIFVPAMNVNMWEHPATQANIRTLGNRGMRVLDPDSGDLICGWQGTGRFPEIAAIVAAVDALQTEQDLKGVRVIVTAGPTQEAIDPVRFVTNRSTGKMGYALADVAARRGAEVLLISGPTQLPSPAGVSVAHVSTAEEMHKTVFAASQKSSANAQRQVIVMAAAVTDHRPTNPSGVKLKPDKSRGYALEMEPCPDILSELALQRSAISAESGLETRLVGFAAETCEASEIVALARDKIARKGCDLIVANIAAEAFGRESCRVWIVDSGGKTIVVPEAKKTELADKILSAAIAV